MSTRQDRVLGTVVGGIVAVAVAGALFASTRPTPTWSSTTPEGTVQAYLSAVLDGDMEKAAGYLSPESTCDVHDLDTVGVVHTARADLVGTTIEGERARVDVDLALTSDGPFDTLPTENHTFRLTRSGERWLLVGQPWPLYDCGGDTK
jgi:hypothetical protein